MHSLANDDLESVCTGLPEEQTGRLRQRADGRWRLADTVDQQKVLTAVHDRPDGVDEIFQWFDMVCPGIAGDGDAPELVASGQRRPDVPARRGPLQLAQQCWQRDFKRDFMSLKPIG